VYNRTKSYTIGHNRTLYLDIFVLVSEVLSDKLHSLRRPERLWREERVRDVVRLSPSHPAWNWHLASTAAAAAAEAAAEATGGTGMVVMVVHRRVVKRRPKMMF
jgi:hypothetical protein